MPKLTLIANFAPDRQESMQRFADLFRDGFSARAYDVEVLRPAPRFTRLVKTYRYGGLPKYLGYLDKFVLFPRALRRHARSAPRDAVYHIVDHANAVYAPDLPADRLVVTVHDLLQIRSALGEFPQNPIGKNGQKYQRWILRHLATLRHAPCVSEKTRQDLHRLTGIPEAATPVIHNGLNYPYRPMPPEEATALLNLALTSRNLPPISSPSPITPLPSPPLYFSIGGAQWYKNRTGLCEIFARLHALAPADAKPRLLYAGPPLDLEQQNLLASHNLTPAFTHLSGLTNEEIRAAYSLARGLIFPSWEEGFGWPIAEAQACGCPVFTSNRAPMTEVGGPAARYFDPADPEAAAQLIHRSVADFETLRAASLTHAQRWQTSTMLDAYQDLYASLIK